MELEEYRERIEKYLMQEKYIMKNICLTFLE